MATSDDIRNRLLAIFAVEADEHLRSLEQRLRTLESDPPAEEAHASAEAMFREVHTLKGAARSVGLRDVEALCQACEAVLSRVTRLQLPLTPRLVGLLQQALDGVALLVADPAADVSVRELARALDNEWSEPGPRAGSTPAPEPSAPTPSPGRDPAVSRTETIRLSTASLDALVVQSEELLAAKLSAADRVEEAAALVAELAELREGLARAAPGDAGRDGLDAARAIERRARALESSLAEHRRSVDAGLDALMRELRRVRVVPAATVLDLFPRMARELARAQGKDVDCTIEGSELDVDRKLLETLKEPLIHLVRNAIDHGIEAPEARRAAGKPRRGRVVVRIAPEEGERIGVVVEDDGRGLDVGRLRAAAVRARVLSAEAAEALTDDAAIELAYRSGLSTSAMISDLSGHGLGLAIAREEIELLDGRIDVETRAGRGTTFRMLLPAAIATFRGLLVRASGLDFLLPLESVERAIRVRREDVQSLEGEPAVAWESAVIRLVRLDEALGLTGGVDHDLVRCVVVRAAGQHVAVAVDEVLGDREAVVKSLPRPLVRVRTISGVAMLGTGRSVPIVRPADLVRARGRITPPGRDGKPREPSRPPSLLVVDDAVTTRTMERSLFEAAGYRVRVAVDGVDAWTALNEEDFDAVVSDVDMPRMDGFELTERIRSDPRLADLPVVLVTALEAREDKERGLAVGANAYVVKSTFEQSNLLEIVARLGIAPQRRPEP